MNHSNVILLLGFLLLASHCTSQHKQDYNWLFGRDESFTPGQSGYIFDFNTNPLGIRKRKNGIGIEGHNASISDEDGNLLFYSNGCAVLNRFGEVMPNGHDIIDTVYMQKWNKDCKYGYSGGQNIMILPNPDGSNTYYLINKPKVFRGFNEDFEIPIWYNIIDMDLDNGKGDVIEKNVVLYSEKNALSNYLTSIRHKNQKNWWVIQPIENSSFFLTYLIDHSGFVRYPDQNSNIYFDRDQVSASGTSKFSPDGKKYAMYNEVTGLLIYDFDRESGILSNLTQVYPIDTSGIGIFCSVEWSPNSRFIYTATSTYLHQIDTWEQDIQNDGIRLIAEWDGTNDPFPNTFYLMAQGPDCKIYMCSTSANNSYHVIKNPDELGTNCNFCQSCLPLPEAANFGSMPNFPRFRVDAAEKCDSTIDLVLGLPVWYEEQLEVYPNPSNGNYTVYIPSGIQNAMVNIYNMQGVLIQQIDKHSEQKINIDLSEFPNGQYIIEVFDTDFNHKTIYKNKLVKMGF